MKKTFFVYDVITDEVLTVVMGVNEKDAIRNLVLSGIFKYMRKEDVRITEVVIKKCKETRVDLDKVLKDLSIELEQKAEKIEGNEDEVKHKIEEKMGDKNVR